MQYRFDYLVIGAGIAGLAAARTLATEGSVAVLSKGAVRESSTHYAQGGIAAALQAEDAPEFHYEDTLLAGDGLCDDAAVKVLVEEGPGLVQELIQLGADFDRVNGVLQYTQEAAHGKRRILHAGDATGKEIEKTLGRALLQESSVQFFSHMMVTGLLLEEGRCVGCEGLSNQGPFSFIAKAVILASGGACQIYKRNTNPPLSTGDGIAMAMVAGCDVQDMEFVQFHPTSLYQGDQKPISLFLISEALRGEGAVLRNAKGERFMPALHALAELAPRDVVSRAIWREMAANDEDCVYLDLSALTVDIPSRFPTIYARCMAANIDLRKEYIPVAPAAHYFIGGVCSDLNGRSQVEGLYVAGEVAATGVHGANRLASNSLLEGLVYGSRAAKDALCHCRDFYVSEFPESSLVLGELSPQQRSAMAALLHQLKEIMWDSVGLERELLSLKCAVQDIRAMSDAIHDVNPKGIFDVAGVELNHMQRVALACAESALAREESRGGHYRCDFPARDDENWSGHLVWRVSEGIVSKDGSVDHVI